MAARLGSSPAKQRPALAFALDETRRADVERWATTRSASGKPGSVASVLECSDITAPDAPTIAKLRLQFDEQEWQVSVDLFRSPSTPEALVELLLREQYQWLPPRSNGPARVERH